MRRRGFVLVAIILSAVLAPFLTPHDPLTTSVLKRLKPIGTEGHWLGTDEIGRDLWARMVYGGRLSLLCGVLPVAVALVVGGTLGVVAGFAGGVVNSAIMRSMDVLYAFPSILLAIAICGILGSGVITSTPTAVRNLGSSTWSGGLSRGTDS